MGGSKRQGRPFTRPFATGKRSAFPADVRAAAAAAAVCACAQPRGDAGDGSRSGLEQVPRDAGSWIVAGDHRQGDAVGQSGPETALSLQRGHSGVAIGHGPAFCSAFGAQSSAFALGFSAAANYAAVSTNSVES